MGADVQDKSMRKNFPRGVLDHESFCLVATRSIRVGTRGYSCGALASAVKKDRMEAEEHFVRGCCGSSVRKMVRIVVRYEGRVRLVLADIVTGSLYSLRTGQCFTGNLHIVD
jgi:hypothetical protein